MVGLPFYQYVLLGLLAGCYGTIVGLGGGFIVVPARVMLAKFSPQQAVATSLVVVFANAVSGNISYRRQKRIDIATGWRFGLASIPGSVVGVQLSRMFSPEPFRIAFGILLIGASTLLMARPGRRTQNVSRDGRAERGRTFRRLVDASGNVCEYTFDMKAGIALSVFAGAISALFGVGGGIIYVPVLVYVFCFPPHIATATSLFVLLISAFAGAVMHGLYSHTVYSAGISTGIGAIVGAQLGAALSRRLKGVLIVRLLAGALLLAGIRLIFG
ncbi:MAG: sulfite exporter TauE/SafE family protein [Candidatus Eisenbacteria bacterium]